MRQGSFSRLTRETGLSPFWAAGALFPVGLLGAVLNFFLGHYRTKKLLAAGCSEIYKILKPKGNVKEVAFGLGEQHGVRLGQICDILRPDGTYVGRGEVKLCESRYASMLLPQDAEVAAGYIAHPLPEEVPLAPKHLRQTGAPLAPRGILHG